MAIPPFSDFARPLLQLASEHVDGVKRQDAMKVLATQFKLTEKDCAEVLSRGQLVFHNRIDWAYAHLHKAGLIDRKQRGVWYATPAGVTWLQKNPPSAGAVSLKWTPSSSGASTSTAPSPVPALAIALSPPEATHTPKERLLLAFEEATEAVRDELHERLLATDPTTFERVVLDLLESMGYTRNFGRTMHTGGPGDGGIDGFIEMDRLGLDRIYMQAKRYKDSVNHERIHQFAGAMQVNSASRGVFVTTGHYTEGARKVAQSLRNMRLIDGVELTKLMIEFGVGISHERLRPPFIALPKVDIDYFESA